MGIIPQGRGGISPVVVPKTVKGGVIGGPGYGGAKSAGGGGGVPKLPSFGDLFGGGGGGAKPPQTTVLNGKAMVMGPGGWVAQDSADGKSILSGGGPIQKQQGGPGSLKPGAYDPGGGPNLSNYAQKDPRIEQANRMLDQRYQQSASKEGQMDPYLMESIQNLRTQMGSDQTGRATNRALSSIRDQASGLEQAARERSAMTGQGGGMMGKISEAAQRQGAKAASDIQLAQQQRKDALTLGGHQILGSPAQLEQQRTAQTNALLGQITGSAGQGAQLGLQQQGLGLESWKAANDVGLRKQALDQQMALAPYDLAQRQMGLYGSYLDLLGKAGYGGGYGY